MSKRVVGTCGKCGGRVTQYTMLHIVGPFPSPECESCKSVPKNAMLPVLDMEPSPRQKRRKANLDLLQDKTGLI